MKQLKYIVTKEWERNAIENLFGEEDIFLLSNDTFDDISKDKKYEIVVIVKRGKEVK